MMFPHNERSIRACPLSSWEGDPSRCRWDNTPLIGRQERWCSQACIDEFGRQHWWTNARRAAIQRDGSCLRCGSVERLEVNHIEPRGGRGYGSGCHHHLDGLETLCHAHHVEVTNQQRIVRSIRGTTDERSTA